MKVYKFSAAWCAPCKKVVPIFDKVAEEYPNIEFKHLDADTDKELVKKYEIMSLPTILIVDGLNRELARYTGTFTEQRLRDMIDNATPTKS